MSDIHELLEQAQELPYGPERLALAEEAVRLADLAQDEAAGYEARKELIDTATFSGQGERMLVAFAWCRAYLDAHPELDEWYEQAGMLWKQKWVLNAMQDFPQIPLGRIHEVYQDYERRIKTFGMGAGTVPYFRMHLSMHRGDTADAAVAFNLWQFARRDLLSDCEACESNSVASYQQFMGDHAACMAQIDRMLARGDSCSHVPHSTHGMALTSLMHLGRWAEAALHHAQGREMVAGEPDHLRSQANHLKYLALADQAGALEWYARHVSWAERTGELDDRMEFQAASALLFSELRDQGRDSVSLALPQDVPGYRLDGVYSVQERFAHHVGEAGRIAALFDARNGTDAHAQRLERTLALAKLPRSAPQPGTAGASA